MLPRSVQVVAAVFSNNAPDEVLICQSPIAPAVLTGFAVPPVIFAPGVPAGPVAPAAPVAPVGPAAPVAPTAPVGPAAPVSPRGIVKLSVAAELVPAFVTEAPDPAVPVVTVPTATVAAAPAAPVVPVFPIAPRRLNLFSQPPAVLSNISWVSVRMYQSPTAWPAGAEVVGAAVPRCIKDPLAPVGPVAPTSPRGIVKLSVAAELVPALVTEAPDPAVPVVTVPTATVAAVPVAPVAPVAPTSPRGIVNSKLRA